MLYGRCCPTRRAQEPFDAKDFAAQGIAPVIAAIEQMQQELKDEEADDIEQR